MINYLHNKAELCVLTFGDSRRRSIFRSGNCILMREHYAVHALILSHEKFGRCMNIAIKEMQINEEIGDKEVRVITDSGEQLGIMSSRDALREAESRDLDLVKIAPQATPPVCKIMDYSKYRFEQAKREKEQKKNQRVVEIKEVRLSLNIDKHDFDTKVNQAKKFLSQANKVKVTIRFRGREMAHPENGLVIMNNFSQACQEVSSVEKAPKLEGRSMMMFLAPKTTK